MLLQKLLVLITSHLLLDLGKIAFNCISNSIGKELKARWVFLLSKENLRSFFGKVLIGQRLLWTTSREKSRKKPYIS